WAHLQSWQLVWSTDLQSLERARELAERGLARDDTLVDAHRLLAQTYLWKKDHDRALGEARKTVVLGPNDADGYEPLAGVLGWAGHAEESLEGIRQAMRLNPHYPVSYLWTLGHGYYLAGRRQEATDAFKSLVGRNPNFVPAHAYLAVLYSEMGQQDAAREEWQTASRLSPGASLVVLQQRLPYRRPADLERFLSAVRQAGVE